MKRVIFILFCFFILPMPLSWSTDVNVGGVVYHEPSAVVTEPPPQGPTFLIQDITLTYDLNKSNLHVEAKHHSNNWEIDYIRMMTISVNGQEVSTTNYSHQTNVKDFRKMFI